MPSTKFKLKAPQPKEQDHQVTLFSWIDKVGCIKWPELRWAYSVPNGASYYGQHRYAEAGKQRSMGLRRGVPDVCVPVCQLKHPFKAGLYIEFKRSAEETLSVEQEAYRDYLISAGYAWARCNSGQDAIDTVTAYMEGRFTQQ